MASMGAESSHRARRSRTGHRDAVKLLIAAEAEGIELRSCPAYIREWITNERESS